MNAKDEMDIEEMSVTGRGATGGGITPEDRQGLLEHTPAAMLRRVNRRPYPSAPEIIGTLRRAGLLDSLTENRRRCRGKKQFKGNHPSYECCAASRPRRYVGGPPGGHTSGAGRAYWLHGPRDGLIHRELGAVER